MKTKLNFNGMNGQKAVEKALRIDIQDTLIEFCRQTYGVESVSETQKGITIARGYIKTDDEEQSEVCATIMIKAENYDDRITRSGKLLRKFDRLKEHKIFLDKYFQKPEKKEDKKSEAQTIKAIEEIKKKLARLEAKD